MTKIKEKIKSVRFRLFATMCVVITIIVGCLILANNVVLETFYLYSKTTTVRQVYQKINNYYKYDLETSIESELRRIAFNNNFDIFIKSENDVYIFSTDKDFYNTLNRLNSIEDVQNNDKNIVYQDTDIKIIKVDDTNNNISYLLLTGKLCNGYSLYIRIPVVPIEESVQISNRVLVWIGAVTILISAFVASFVSKKFTTPILELNDIANRMARLDFSQKYRTTDTEDEINALGHSINTMSDKLETTIRQLRSNNIELEKDIEEKSKIDEMRKQFISDVSHELKTPIALIQGYAEGLVENVNSDEESRKFYAEVILDEANRMDKLVKQLLELMKLEYGKREFHNQKINLVELTHEVIRKCRVMIEERQIQIDFEDKNPVYVYADELYIEQVITNYFTNAIKHCDELNGKKEIKIKIGTSDKNGKVRLSVFNTGENIAEEDLDRIWVRFYKVDSSRNRENGGSGIGLALVRAIMNSYHNDYGVINHEDGVEFYFELNEILALSAGSEQKENEKRKEETEKKQ